MAEQDENQEWEMELSHELQQEEETPKLYSKTLILVFALLFSTIFAAALLVVNLRSLDKKRAAAWVLFFAIAYLFATAMLIQALNLDPSLTFVANVIGAAILNEYFWNKYIGRDTAYEKRSWIKPTAISILVVMLFFFVLFQGM